MALPESIEIVEVSPRDGLQSLGKHIPVDTKLALIECLIAAGLRTIEVTGFAHPAKIPQFADAEALCERLRPVDGVVYRAMAPNARGALRAVATPVHEVVGLTTASAAYLARNQNMTPETAVSEALEAFRIADGAGRMFTMAIGLAFWCAYEGPIPEDRVLGLLRTLRNGGVRKFYLAATVGLETPIHVSSLFAQAAEAVPDGTFGFHVHNLAGRAPALTLAALEAGAQWVEGAVCGIGGGIAMPAHLTSVGNYATEDCVTLLNDCGVATGIDSQAIVTAARDVSALLNVPIGSYAGNGAWRGAVRKPQDQLDRTC